jgi:hypothetical protein
MLACSLFIAGQTHGDTKTGMAIQELLAIIEKHYWSPELGALPLPKQLQNFLLRWNKKPNLLQKKQHASLPPTVATQYC